MEHRALDGSLGVIEGERWANCPERKNFCRFPCHLPSMKAIESCRIERKINASQGGVG